MVVVGVTSCSGGIELILVAFEPLESRFKNLPSDLTWKTYAHRRKLERFIMVIFFFGIPVRTVAADCHATEARKLDDYIIYVSFSG